MPERLGQLTATLLSIVLLTTAHAGDLQVGLEALKWGDYATALHELRPLAEQGHAPAQYHFGLMYEFGWGVPEDDAEAAEWHRKAAEQGHAEAQYYLGARYAFGMGVPKDDAEAVKWYRKAAQQGHTGAQGILGYMSGQSTECLTSLGEQ